jgi:hypothetical protein
MRCFGRSETVVAEEIPNLRDFQRTAEAAELKGNRERWAVVPDELRGGHFDPIILSQSSLYNLGQRVCINNGGKGSKCIPIYRTRFAYVFRVNVAAWFAVGAVCTRYTNEGETSGQFLIDSGIATARLADVEGRFNEWPCVHVPTLVPAWEASAAWLKTLDHKSRIDIVGSRRRRLLGAERPEDDF